MNTTLNIASEVGGTAPGRRSLRLSRHEARSEPSISVYLLFMWAGCPHPAALRPSSLGGLGTCLRRNVAASVSEWNLSSSLHHVAASVSEWMLEFERRHDPQLFVGVTPVGGVPSPRILSK